MRSEESGWVGFEELMIALQNHELVVILKHVLQPVVSAYNVAIE